MSESAKEYMELLKLDFFTTRIEWRLYRSLFGTNKETVDLLNEISGPTAHTLERILFERTLLNIRKLTDPATGRRGRSKGVTVKGLKQFCNGDHGELTRLVSQAERAASFARNWADKRIVHSDLDYRLGNAKLETASRQKVENVLEAISLVIKWFAKEKLGYNLNTHPVPALKDERLFLETLYKGQLARREEKLHRKTLREDRNWDELDQFESNIRDLPHWIKRDDPPIDVH